MTKTKTSRKQRKITVSQEVQECRMRKCREVRDLYNKFKPKYNYYAMLDWFRLNYFVQEMTLLAMIRRSDNLPIDHAQASINYTTAIKPDFNL